jgi:hypothetical protein
MDSERENLQWLVMEFAESVKRIEELEAALRDVYEVYAGSEGMPRPMTAAEGYLLQLVKEMANITRAALAGEKKDE